MAYDVFGDYRYVANLFLAGADYSPSHRRHVRRYTPVNVLVKKLHNLRPAHLPPRLRAGDLLPVVQSQRVGKVRVRIGLGFVIVDRIGQVRVIIRPWAQCRDLELIHGSLAILLCGQLHRWGQGGRSGTHEQGDEQDKSHNFLHVETVLS